MQSNPVNWAGVWGLLRWAQCRPPGSPFPCRAPGPQATSRGCYQGCHLGFLLRQAGWWRPLKHCGPSRMAALCQLCLLLPTPVSISPSELIFSAVVSQTSSLRPETKFLLSARRFALLSLCSWTSGTTPKPHITTSSPCPVLLALFSSPGCTSTDLLRSLSLNVVLHPSEEILPWSLQNWIPAAMGKSVKKL